MALGEDLPWGLHATLPRSRGNGPGERFVVWTQGCTLACPGCFNPETHRSGNAIWTVRHIVSQVFATPGIEGVTVSGGEPLEQPAALAAFARDVSAVGLGVVVLTGFSRAEIEAQPRLAAAVADADMVIAGRYNPRLHLASGLRGSSNKEYWALTKRYSPSEFEAVPDVEVFIAPDGTVTVTGMVAATGGVIR